MTLKTPWPVNQQVILPSKTVLEFSRIIGNQTGEAEMAFTDTQALLKFNNTEIISRLVDGQYPDYKQIIPANFSTKIITNKLSLASALKTTGIFSQSTNSVKFDYQAEKQTLLLVTESQELGKSDVDLPAQVEGRSGTVILNYRYILDCLANIGSEKVQIKIIDDSSPSLFVPEGQEDYLYLVMPIKS